ncbi:TPA: hypothetical protein ACH3X3_010747 [Trebouxia sp. C0006]
MQSDRLVLSVLAVLTIFARSNVADMACLHSGYCSQGKLTPFVGDLYTSSALREALQARSYKKEVIIMVSDLNRLDSFLQAAGSLQHLGLSNILLLSHSEAMCGRISPIVSSIGCTWSSHKHPTDLAGNFYVWSLRYRILARSVRLGYNVLMLDTDVMLMDDPYKYLKQPPFKDITVLNQAESPFDPNGGVLYVQNAAPDGPAAFMFAEIVSRPYRWADDHWYSRQEIHTPDVLVC